MNVNTTDTIVALSTPQGEGAIGVIRMSGTKAIQIADKIFIGAKLENKASHTLHYGKLEDNGKLIDEVVIGMFKNPKSYTGEDVIEISCHGSPFIIKNILQICLENGARMANAGEFTLRAFLNGKMDLSQAEAVMDLIASDSQSSHELALKQMRGGFSEEIQRLRQELIDFAALIELELDFGEEDVEFANRDDLKELIYKILDLIQKLINSFALGNVIKTGVSTVIAGRPNAGKSTLLNALLNEERAIVSHIAGTTRDTIEEIININGIPFRLIDTAGIRKAQSEIEKIGVDRTMDKIDRSSLVIYVFDVMETSPKQLLEDVQRFLFASKSLTHKSKKIFVANKMDLNPYTKPEDYYKVGLIGKSNLVTVSAINKMNIETLKDYLFNTVLDGDIDPSNTIVTNARHHDALQKSADGLERVINGMKSGLTSDLIAMDIRQSLYHLGEITGEISSDDLLDSIFSRFCIGK